MRPWRELRIEAIREYCGRFYYEDDGKRRPLNLVNRGINIILPHLATHRPRELVTAKRTRLRGEADMLGMVLTELDKEMGRVHLSRMAVFEALVGPAAIVRVGLRAGPESVILDGQHWDLGEPGARITDLDDYGIDPAARSLEEAAWEYERYRLPRSVALESGVFAGHEDIIRNMRGLRDGVPGDQAEAERLTSGDNNDRHDLGDAVEFLDVAIRGEDGAVVFVTLPADEGYEGEYLREDEWLGWERGPFLRLEFFPIAAQPMGVPWVAHSREQSESMNKVFGKIARQVEQTKRLLVASRQTSADDIETLRQARDGDTVFVDGTPSELVQAVELGGVAKELLGLVGLLQEWANTQSGNLDILGGTGSDAKTATEFSSLRASANVIVEDMARTHEMFQGELSASLAWHLIHDPLILKTTTKRLPGGHLVDVTYSAEAREGAWSDFEFKIEHQSMGRQDPNARARRLVEIMNLAMQSAAVTMQTGGAWNTEAFLRIIGREFQLDEIDELWLAGNLEAVQMQAATGPAMGTPMGPGRVRVQAPAKRGTTGANALQGAMVAGGVA